jgi:hypothetical protein
MVSDRSNNRLELAHTDQIVMLQVKLGILRSGEHVYVFR